MYMVYMFAATKPNAGILRYILLAIFPLSPLLEPRTKSGSRADAVMQWLIPATLALAGVVGQYYWVRPIGRRTCRGRHERYGESMITAIVFVKADVARIPEVAEAIASLDGVSEVYSVTGQIDLIALVRVREHEDVASVVADRLNKVEGVTETETHIAFRTYSKHDLESAFSIGLD